MKKKTFLCIIISLMMLLFVSCGSDSNNKSNKNDSQTENQEITVRVANMGTNWIMLTAEKKGFFEEELKGKNAKVELINVGSAAEQTEAFAAKGLDIGGGGDLAILTSIGSGINLDIIGIGKAENLDNWGLVAAKDSNINSISDIKGKKVGVALGSGLHHLLGNYLKSVGYTFNDIEVINLSPADAYTSLIAGAVEVAVTNEPFITQAKEQGSKLICTAEGYCDMLSCNVVASDFAKEHPDIVKAVISAEYKAYKWAKESEENENEALGYVEDLTGVPVETLKITFDKTTFEYSINQDLLNGIQDTADYLYEQELINEKIDISKSINKELLKDTEFTDYSN